MQTSDHTRDRKIRENHFRFRLMSSNGIAKFFKIDFFSLLNPRHHMFGLERFWELLSHSNWGWELSWRALDTIQGSMVEEHGWGGWLKQSLRRSLFEWRAKSFRDHRQQWERDFKISDNGRDLSVNGQLCLPTRCLLYYFRGLETKIQCIWFPFELQAASLSSSSLCETSETFFILKLSFGSPV